MTEHAAEKDARPELLNAARDPEVIVCVAEGGGIEHDFREVTDPNGWYPGSSRTYLRCVWCHAVACGNHDEPDPCIEVWHHEPKPHRARSGETWPIGGDRCPFPPAVTEEPR